MSDNKPQPKPSLPKPNITRVVKGSEQPTARQPLPKPNRTRPFRKGVR